MFQHHPFSKVGVVSTGSGGGHCATANSPGDVSVLSLQFLKGLYVRVKNYLAWIKKHAASGACDKTSPKINSNRKTTKRKKKKSKKKKHKKKKKRKKRKKKKSGRRRS